MRRLSLESGQYVYRVDDPSESIFLVRSGKIELTTLYPETGEGVDARFGPGHVFGEVELIDSRPRVSSARVSDSAQLVEIGRDELIEILYLKPEKSLIIGKSMFEKLRQLYSEESLESELARLREEMRLGIRDAVVAHESRVVTSHNGMAAIAIPIVMMVVLAIGSYWFFHRG